MTQLSQNRLHKVYSQAVTNRICQAD